MGKCSGTPKSKSAQAQATQPEDIAATPDSNGVVDAEFEEVKDDK